jgi:Trypsin-co-occurring domain 1
MTRLVEFPLESGGAAVVEVADDGGRPVTRRFRDEVVVSFGLQLSAEAGAFIAAASTAANFTVSLAWRAAAPEPATSPPDESQGAG